MEFLESIGWIALGFIPTLVGLELAYRGMRRFVFYPKKQTKPMGEKLVEVPF